MRAPVTLCAALFLALLVAIPATATPDGFLEAWFLYEQGKAKMDSPGGGELGEALLLFAQAIDKRGGAFPEAELAIGDIYRAEGAFAIHTSTIRAGTIYAGAVCAFAEHAIAV